MKFVFITFVVVLTLFFSANAFKKDADLIDYRLMVTKKQVSPFLGEADCNKDNVLVCQDCTSIGLCIPNGNGGWNVIDGGKCAEGETCLKGACTKGANPPCASTLDFICTSTGMFPNQEDCKRYHFCVKDASNALTPFSDLCTDNYGYHSESTYCSKKMKTEECNYYPVPLCKTLGEKGDLTENSVLYYVCIRRTDPVSNLDVLYPVIHACEHGRNFNKYSKKCETQ